MHTVQTAVQVMVHAESTVSHKSVLCVKDLKALLKKYFVRDILEASLNMQKNNLIIHIFLASCNEL